jgi:hypothetical protein
MHNQATQPPIEQQQIDAIPFRADAKAPLTCHKCEIVAEFQQESFQLSDQRVFEIRFRVLVLQIQEFEHKRIASIS